MKSETEMPRRATKHSAGYDFYMPYDLDLRPGEWTMIDTGVCFDGAEKVWSLQSNPTCEPGLIENHSHMMNSWFMMVVPRSGLGTKYGFRMRNTLGIIDMDYRDTIKACVTVDKPLHLKKGDRFMQGIILPYGIIENEVTPTKEREGGHGSTGH